MNGKRGGDADATEDRVQDKDNRKDDDKDEDSPRDTPWKEKRRLVRLAKRAVAGDEGARDQVWNHHEVRQAVAERFQFFLLLFFASAVVFLFFSARMLSEDVRRGVAAQWAARVHGCAGQEALDSRRRRRECLLLFHRAEDWYHLAVGAVAVACLLTSPLNGTVLVLVCRRDYSRNIWFCWLCVHYLVMFFLAVSLLLMPLALGLYWVIQAMKQYAVTFETNVPLA